MKSIRLKTSAPNGQPLILKFGPVSGKLKRNSACFCGSGRKFKDCCRGVLSRPAPRLPAHFLIELRGL